jgi:hypothetical protein
MGLDRLLEHYMLCLSREGTARWQPASRLFLQYFWRKNHIYIKHIENYAQKLADYTFGSAGQAEKLQIARYCVCTTYPHYVPLTLDGEHFFLGAAQSQPNLAAHSSPELKCNSSGPISAITRVSFDLQEICHPIFLSIY